MTFMSYTDAIKIEEYSGITLVENTVFKLEQLTYLRKHIQSKSTTLIKAHILKWRPVGIEKLLLWLSQKKKIPLSVSSQWKQFYGAHNQFNFTLFTQIETSHRKRCTVHSNNSLNQENDFVFELRQTRSIKKRDWHNT